MVTLGFEASGYIESLSDLPLEYERSYGTAKRALEIPDIFDNVVVSGSISINGSLRTERFGDLILSYIGASGNGLPHSFLVRWKAV